MKMTSREEIVKAIGSVGAAFGLSKPEASFYAAALKHGSAPVSKVAREAGLNRSSSYAVVASLVQKGLLGRVKKSKGLFVTPVSPKRILDIQQERHDSLTRQVGLLEEFFSQAKTEPGVSFFEGPEGLKAVLNAALEEAKEICVFGDGDAFRKLIPGWMERYSARRSERKIKVRLLLKATPQTIGAFRYLRSSEPDEKKAYTDLRLLPETMGIKHGFDVYGHKVIMYSFEERPAAIVIESKAVSAMMRSVFDILWQVADVYQRPFTR
jgi:sugar-specific transcriptional regulator TrmB